MSRDIYVSFKNRNKLETINGKALQERMIYIIYNFQRSNYIKKLYKSSIH